MLGLLQLIAQCSFYARVSSLNIFLGYEKLKALKLDPKTLTTSTKKPCEEFLIFIIYIYTTKASDVTHIRKILMSKLMTEKPGSK